MTDPGRDPELLIERARSGDREALDELFELYGNYLQLLARVQTGRVARPRLSPSDLVQQTLLEAYRDFGQFRGRTEGELVAWLRRAFARNLADAVKHHEAQLRDHRRRESLDRLLDESNQDIERALAAGLSSPSGQASRREQAVLLADALAALPEHYRDVIVMRHLERRSVAEIAEHLGRSEGAVRMLWARALERLREILEDL